MKKKKKKRNVKPPTDYEKKFLEFFYEWLKDIVPKNETTISQMAGDCDIDLPNLCRLIREKTSAGVISLLRLTKPMGHFLGEGFIYAERKADEWQKQEDEKKKKKNLI